MKSALVVLGMFLCLTVWVTWPLVVKMDSLILDVEDGLLQTWILNWNVFHPFDYKANIYYPFKNSLAYSETLMLQSLMVVPVVRYFHEPLVAYNLNFLAGFAFTGFALYLLLGEFSKDKLKNFLLAGIFTFSPLRVNFVDIVHLQMSTLWPLFFALIFLKRRNAVMFVVFFILSGMASLLFLFFLLSVLSVKFILNKDMRWWVMGTGFVLCFLVVPLMLPYVEVSRLYAFNRDIRDAIHFSMVPADVDKLGWGMGILSLIMAWQLKKWKEFKLVEKEIVTIACVAFILAFGPALHIIKQTVHIGPIPVIPLPYAVFYYLIPGFSGFRAAFRWILLFGVFVTIFAAMKIKIRPVLLVILLLVTLWEIKPRFKYFLVAQAKEFPAEQRWLRDNYGNEPIIQMPIYNWDDFPGRDVETMREYYSTIHFHPMVNGFSGFSPARWQEKVMWLQSEFPSGETVRYLKSIKVKLVVMPNEWKQVNGLKLIKRFERVSVFEID